MALRLGKRQVCVDQTEVIGQLIGVAGKKDLVAERNPPWHELVDVPDDARRAGVRQSIVVLGLVPQVISPAEHAHEHLLDPLARGTDSIQIDRIVAVARTELDQVPLIADDVHDLVLAEHPSPGRERLALLLADLGRNRQELIPRELEAQQSVSRPLRIGVERLDEKPDRPQVVQAVRAVLPGDVVIVDGPIAGVPDVVDIHPAANEFRPGDALLVPSPVAVVGGARAEGGENEGTGHQAQGREERVTEEPAKHVVILARTNRPSEDAACSLGLNRGYATLRRQKRCLQLEHDYHQLEYKSASITPCQILLLP